MFKDNKRVSVTDTLIGQGTHIEGKMICEACLRIEGEYSGDIDCMGDIIIGESGIARCNITAKDITVAGTVLGEITTKGRLTVTATGQVTGNVNAHTLIIHDGGMINGNFQMERITDSPARPLSETNHSSTKDAKDNSKESAARDKEKARQAG
ncbi:MAG: polymer-forming cytoskeletal protein [Candidatus Pristimantibacillus sp.]